jgi:DNA-binding CsgD family transcriptional regulator
VRRIQVVAPGYESHLLILSPVERAALLALLSGLPPKEISYRMGMSVPTLVTHLSRMMGALGVHSRAELTRWALTYPEAMAGYAASPEQHPEGCECFSPYCTGVRIARQLVSPAAAIPAPAVPLLRLVDR